MYSSCLEKIRRETMKNVRFILAIHCFFLTILYSQGAIEGKITDENGTAISGANVYVINSDIGSISDIDGNYSLSSVPEGESVLVVDFIGYEKPIMNKQLKKNSVHFYSLYLL